MNEPSQETDLERRKQVRLRRRPDTEVGAQLYEGTSYFVVKDPASLRYYRFDQYDYFLFTLMDGSHTLEEIGKAFEARFPPRRINLEELEAFGQVLLKAGLVSHDSPWAAKMLYEQYRKRRHADWLRIVTSILYIEVPLFDPDRLLGRVAVRLRWLLRPWCFIVSLGLVLAAILLVAIQFDRFWGQLPSYQEFFNFKNLLYLWLAIGVVKVLHEVGHGLMCKHFGGEVHDMGALFMCLSPCLYINVSDAWTFPEKWKRIAVGLAGIYIEVFLAALAALLWWNTPGHLFLHQLALSVMIVCGVNTLLFNGNPLLRFDGYYVLADWLEIPNLRERCNSFLKYIVSKHCLGMAVTPQPAMALWRRVGFVLYAIASYIYGWIVTFGVLWFLSQFLAPYKLQTISILMACYAAGSMAGWPLFRLGKGLHQRGWQLPAMQPTRVTVTLTVVVTILLACFLVPLPISRVREAAVVQFHPQATEPVFPRLPGTLERLYVREGEWVQPGELLAEFRNLELEWQLQEAHSQHAVRLVQLRTLRQQAAQLTDLQERNRIETSISQVDGERQAFAEQVALCEKAQQQTVLRAPRAGLVIGLPRLEEVGKHWPQDQSTALCSIGDPHRLRALVPVTPADYRLLTEDLSVADVAVTVRVQGWGSRTWPGTLTHLPASEAKTVPPALTTRFGGPLAVRPNSRPGEFVPQDQHYLVAIDLLEAENDGICPGALAQVKIHCRWRTLAWWLWRTVSLAFDLGLV